MSNWYNEYILKFHIVFTHYDKRTESIYNELIIEAKTPELAKKIKYMNIIIVKNF